MSEIETTIETFPTPPGRQILGHNLLKSRAAELRSQLNLRIKSAIETPTENHLIPELGIDTNTYKQFLFLLSRLQTIQGRTDLLSNCAYAQEYGMNDQFTAMIDMISKCIGSITNLDHTIALFWGSFKSTGGIKGRLHELKTLDILAHLPFVTVNHFEVMIDHQTVDMVFTVHGQPERKFFVESKCGTMSHADLVIASRQNERLRRVSVQADATLIYVVDERKQLAALQITTSQLEALRSPEELYKLIDALTEEANNNFVSPDTQFPNRTTPLSDEEFASLLPTPAMQTNFLNVTRSLKDHRKVPVLLRNCILFTKNNPQAIGEISEFLELLSQNLEQLVFVARIIGMYESQIRHNNQSRILFLLRTLTHLSQLPFIDLKEIFDSKTDICHFTIGNRDFHIKVWQGVWEEKSITGFHKRHPHLLEAAKAQNEAQLIYIFYDEEYESETSNTFIRPEAVAGISTPEEFFRAIQQKDAA